MSSVLLPKPENQHLPAVSPDVRSDHLLEESVASIVHSGKMLRSFPARLRGVGQECRCSSQFHSPRKIFATTMDVSKKNVIRPL